MPLYPSSLIPPQSVQPVQLVQPRDDVAYGSPEWWLYSLENELKVRDSLVRLYEDEYAGRHKLTFASSRFREAFGQMLAAVCDNWFPLIIGASVERLVPQGFLFGEDKKGDSDAWDIWQRNYLDADAPLAFTEACKHGESYLLVWPDANGEPRITVEHPSQMVVRRVAGDRRLRAAALKVWCEDDGTDMATLYLPDALYYYQRKNGTDWQERRAPAKNPFGVVPVIPIVNDPQMLPSRPPYALSLQPHVVNPNAYVGLGRSDMADFVSSVDQINKLVCDMMVASEVAAFRQRWATGLEVPRDENDDPVEPFKAAVDRLWVAEGEDGADVKFGEFSATDLSNYTGAIEQRTQSLAARSRTPPHYLLGQMVNIPADGMKVAETGLASKVEGKQISSGESLEEAIRLAFQIKGDRRAEDYSAQVDWAPAESRSESEFTDSLVKKLSLGVPKEQLWRDAGYSPQEIARFKSMLLEESTMRDLFGIPDPNQPEPSGEPADNPAD